MTFLPRQFTWGFNLYASAVVGVPAEGYVWFYVTEITTAPVFLLPVVCLLVFRGYSDIPPIQSVMTIADIHYYTEAGNTPWIIPLSFLSCPRKSLAGILYLAGVGFLFLMVNCWHSYTDS